MLSTYCDNKAQPGPGWPRALKMVATLAHRSVKITPLRVRIRDFTRPRQETYFVG